MLMDFSLAGFRSFNEEQFVSLEATRIREYSDNVVEPPGREERLLKSLVIYGANSSGKSNLIRGMGMMRHLLFSNFQQKSTDPLPYDPYLLSPNGETKPTRFEIRILTRQNRVYRYGFSYERTHITEEWLFDETQGETPLFVRVDDGIDVRTDFPEGMDLEERTRDNALFLSVVNQFNGPISNEIIEWFTEFGVLDGIGHSEYRAMTFEMLDDAEGLEQLTKFYQSLDLGFERVEVDRTPFDLKRLPFEIPDEVKIQIQSDLDGKTMLSLNSVHVVKDENEVAVREQSFHVRSQESSGTNKLIDLSGPIFDALKNGGVLVVDELDAKLHPHLTLAILRLFRLPQTNPNRAQLIFATHDSHLLTRGELRRDQILFTENYPGSGTVVYPLVEFKVGGTTIRKDRSFEKDYLKGRYGGIPILKELPELN